MGKFAVKSLVGICFLCIISMLMTACGKIPSSDVLADLTDEDTAVDEQQVLLSERHMVEIPFCDVIMNIVWEPGTFFEDPAKWQNELQIASLALCAATQTAQATAEQTFSLLGFSSLKCRGYDNLANINEPAITIGSQRIVVEGEERCLIAVAIRGTTSFGDLWTDVESGMRKSLKGPADAEYSLLDSYVKEQGIRENDAILLVTGHSLGGGAALLVGQMCSNVYGTERTFVYTYAPLRTAEQITENTDNILSVINATDKVPFLLVSSSSVGRETLFSGQDSKLAPYFELLAGIGATLPTANADSTPVPDANHDVNVYMAYLMSKDSYGDWPSRIRQLWEKPDGFSIEGKWKSTGSVGFGQAQPGSIVVFDGDDEGKGNCNFYSPKDTYRFYRSGIDGRIWLETTNVLWGDTLSFEVSILSNNEIRLSFGGQTTTLERMQEEALPEYQDESATLDTFSIVGSWESTGSEGFGQAQPGTTVTFDGTHCNFFSPYDTYAFYQDGGQWKLDCTSVLFSQTLTFAVEVIDANSINVYSGTTCTELKRTG